MKNKENIINILIEDIDEEILERMPEWFKILRNTCKEKSLKDSFK